MTISPSTPIVDKELAWRDSYLWFEGLAYFFQGFSFLGLSIYMTVQMANIWGLSYATIALITAVAGIPTFLKMFVGLITDRVFIRDWGRRQPYIAFGGLLYLPSLIALVIIDDFTIFWILAIVLFVMSWVFVDSALDGLTVDVTPSEKTSTIQGAATAGRLGGFGVASAFVTVFAPQIGWDAMLVLVGVSGIIQAFIALWIKEAPINRDEISRFPITKILRDTFLHRRAWIGFLFVMMFIASMGLYTMATAYILGDLGYGADETLPLYGIILIVHFLAAVLGSIIVGRIGKDYSTNWNFYVVSIILSWVLLIPWIFVTTQADLSVIMIAMGTFGIARGMVDVMTLSIAMKLCPDSIEGFMFATMGSFMNIGMVALAPFTISSFEPLIGMNFALLTPIPFAIIGLVLLRVLLKDMRVEQETVEL